MIFESHAHYDDERFDHDREILLKEMPQKGIGYILNVAAHLESAKKSVKLSEQYDYIYCAVGVHPHDAHTLEDNVLNELEALTKHKKVVAVGEIGLDYYYDNAPKAIQKEGFIKQIELAKKVNLPIIVHSREAAKDTMDIIKETAIKNTGGVIHCYSYSYEVAKEYVDMGFYIGIGGVVTFKNAKKLIEVVEKIPLEHLLIETDCPYLAPVPNRGKRNDSTNLVYVAQAIAQIKNIEYDEVVKVTRENAIKLFGIKE
ncbi:TatD DNase family protein [Natranaerovirga hydrolytica]|uniref:TatD DNase family protein n=1 Tax=Natranaerovirga hydrolytica TaxID=680378 RepID=A0A4R1N906_9FIRM|nr:TatD family hydrolase [Natranaerovirga hydrolytica]TCL00051.1 TatD DNase family protein [Natranaerovirga hydrolytica]